jgi:hypothetical protein
VERYFGWLLVAARLLVAVVFLLNGFGIIDQTIPAREMFGAWRACRNCAARYVSRQDSRNRRGVWLGIRNLSSVVRCRPVCLSGSRDIRIAFILAGCRDFAVSRPADQLL